MNMSKKLMILLLAMLACMSVSAQDIMIDETCPPQFPGGDAALINFLNANIKYPSKAAKELGWNPTKTSFEQLVELMVKHDMEKVAVERAEEHIITNLAEYLEKGIVK